MTLSRLLAVAVAAHALLPGPSRAQRTLLRLTGGATRIDQRDDRVSPLRYGGLALGAELALVHRGARGDWAVRVGRSSATLTSAVTSGPTPNQLAARGYFELEVRRGGTWRFGGLLGGKASAWTHEYGPPTGEAVRYSTATWFFAPAVSWSPARARRALDVRLAVPLAALVKRSYSDVRIPAATRFAGPGAVQLIDLLGMWRAAFGRRFDFSAGYRLVLERHDFDARFRIATHAFTTGVGIGWGRP